MQVPQHTSPLAGLSPLKNSRSESLQQYVLEQRVHTHIQPSLSGKPEMMFRGDNVGSLIGHLVIEWAGQGNSAFPCHTADGRVVVWVAAINRLFCTCTHKHTHTHRCQPAYLCWQLWLSSPVSPSIWLQVLYQPQTHTKSWLLVAYIAVGAMYTHHLYFCQADRQMDRLNDTWTDPWKSLRAVAVSLIRHTYSPMQPLTHIWSYTKLAGCNFAQQTCHLLWES